MPLSPTLATEYAHSRTTWTPADWYQLEENDLLKIRADLTQFDQPAVQQPADRTGPDA